MKIYTILPLFFYENPKLWNALMFKAVSIGYNPNKIKFMAWSHPVQKHSPQRWQPK
jgi:hypothetical protein